MEKLVDIVAEQIDFILGSSLAFIEIEDDTNQDEAMVMSENTRHTPHLDCHVIFVILSKRQTSEHTTDTSVVCGWSDDTTSYSIGSYNRHSRR